MLYVLSLFPILLLVILSLWKGVKTAVLVCLVCTVCLFFFWGASLNHFLAVMGVTLVTTVNILLIVLGATFLYSVMDLAGLIVKITRSLDQLHPSKEIRFFLLAICLTAFFEGVAGFGTPGAIVPLILMSLGAEAVLAVSVVLLFNGLFAAFGAVGTPVVAGLQLPLGLSPGQVQTMSLYAAVLLMLAGLLVLFFIFRLWTKDRGPLVQQRQVFLLYGFFAAPFLLFSYFVPELATILAALSMLIFSILYLKRGAGHLDLRPWLPYACLSVLLLLPKISPLLRQCIGWELSMPNMFGTAIQASLKPLQSPLIPFLIVGLGVALFQKSVTLPWAAPLRKTATVFGVLFPSIAIAQLMIHSGVTQPSMVGHISDLFSSMGPAYVAFAPLVGVMGTFITGSTTISNVVFGASQAETAQALGVDQPVMLALQLTGASLGNAICLFNIIAAASIANLQHYQSILVNTLGPTLLAAAVVGLVGLALTQL